MNSDIIYEISKYTNVKNLLLSSKTLYSKSNEQILKNIKQREIKDFLHIETDSALFYLIYKVIYKGRYDLLRKFIAITPHKFLSVLICASASFQLKNIYTSIQHVRDSISKPFIEVDNSEARMQHWKIYNRKIELEIEPQIEQIKKNLLEVDNAFCDFCHKKNLLEVDNAFYDENQYNLTFLSILYKIFEICIRTDEDFELFYIMTKKYIDVRIFEQFIKVLNNVKSYKNIIMKYKDIKEKDLCLNRKLNCLFLYQDKISTLLDSMKPTEKFRGFKTKEDILSRIHSKDNSYKFDEEQRNKVKRILLYLGVEKLKGLLLCELFDSYDKFFNRDLTLLSVLLRVYSLNICKLLNVDYKYVFSYCTFDIFTYGNKEVIEYYKNIKKYQTIPIELDKYNKLVERSISKSVKDSIKNSGNELEQFYNKSVEDSIENSVEDSIEEYNNEFTGLNRYYKNVKKYRPNSKQLIESILSIKNFIILTKLPILYYCKYENELYLQNFEKQIIVDKVKRMQSFVNKHSFYIYEKEIEVLAYRFIEIVKPKVNIYGKSIFKINLDIDKYKDENKYADYLFLYLDNMFVSGLFFKAYYLKGIIKTYKKESIDSLLNTMRHINWNKDSYNCLKEHRDRNDLTKKDMNIYPKNMREELFNLYVLNKSPNLIFNDQIFYETFLYNLYLLDFNGFFKSCIFDNFDYLKRLLNASISTGIFELIDYLDFKTINWFYVGGNSINCCNKRKQLFKMVGTRNKRFLKIILNNFKYYIEDSEEFES